ncbi:hypothetical protein FSP39_015546 [Pinctada imbricata]|uniref:RING-type E3 ubiquitin transferase n=1 Tax=Pinctada imbricata TaxID=66713 RepID=A0AA88YDX0_PINIB|nr:hypothetical protein FSP39_015546 [Pinctada imbricata]
MASHDNGGQNDLQSREPHTRTSPPQSSGTYGSGSGDSFGHQSRDEGYDLEFILRDEKYDCPICLLVLRDPYQTQCGHRFCQRCIFRWLRDSDQRCPIDNAVLSESMLFPDNFAKREIMGLQVMCPNKKEGCNHIETLKHLQHHLDSCPFKCEPCPNKCSHILLRKDLKQHLDHVCVKRKIQCHQCPEYITAEQLEDHLEKECAMSMTECPHCNASMMREQIKRHIDHDCMKVCIDCSFKKLGCTASNIQRGEMGKHRQDQIQFHMNLMCRALVVITEKLNITPDLLHPQAGATTSAATAEISYNSCVNSLADLQRNLSETLASLNLNNSPVVPTISQFLNQPVSTIMTSPTVVSSTESPRSHSRVVDDQRLNSDQTKVESEVTYTSVPSVDQEGALRVPFDRLEFQSMKDQNATQDESLARHEHLIVEMKHKVETSEKNSSILSRRVRLLENTLAEFEGRACNGLYVWKVKNYSKYRREAELGETTAIHSPAFYSSCYGYKLCIRANLNGVDAARGTHLSIFIHFMQGEFDDILDWPFSGRIMLTVMDQNQAMELRHHVMETLVAKPNLAAFQKPVTPRNHKGFGYMEFLPLTVLDNSMYIRNDTLIIKCHVIQTN